jgi:hypothetical protein
MFTRAVLIPSEKPIDLAAKAEQERRLALIRERIELTEDTFEPIYEQKPERRQDRYFKRLAKGGICNMLSQTNDDAVSMEVQTETMYLAFHPFSEYAHQTQNAPTDFARSFEPQKKEVDPMELERFVERMLPLVETALSQGAGDDLESAQGKKTIVEAKGSLGLPAELRTELKLQTAAVVRKSFWYKS